MGYISEKYCIPQPVVTQLIRDGIVDWKVDGLYDFWIFYKELCKTREPKEVRQELMLHYKLTNRMTYYRMIKRARSIFE